MGVTGSEIAVASFDSTCSSALPCTYKMSALAETGGLFSDSAAAVGTAEMAAMMTEQRMKAFKSLAGVRIDRVFDK